MSKGFSYNYSGTIGHIADIASNLPNNPKGLLGNGWKDISNPSAKAQGHQVLKEEDTGLTLTFDKGTPGAQGFKGKNHYHIKNPNATGKSDMYLDENGKPTPKGSKASHILPSGGKNK